MSITHDWSINSVLKFLDNEGTVYRVFFELYSYDEEDPKILQIKTLSFVDLDIHHIDNFIPFDDLTEQEVKDWVYEIVNFENFKESLDEIISNKQHPTTEIKDVPW